MAGHVHFLPVRNRYALNIKNGVKMHPIGLEIKKNASQRAAKALRAQIEALTTPKRESTLPGAKPAPVTSAEDQEIKRIQAMIKESPDLINAKDNDGVTPLQKAARDGQLIVAEFLLANGAEVNATGQSGWTALHFAAHRGHKAIAELLLSRKAELQVTDNDGATPLHLAAGRGFKGVVEVLLAKGATVNARNKRDETPLHKAATGNRAVAELLINNKADVNARDNDGVTPLNRAVVAKQLAMANLLLANRADPNIPGNAHVDNYLRNGFYPVHFAVMSQQAEMLEALLKSGANPNVKSGRGSELTGMTPLRMAVNLNRKDIVELLLNAKADPNIAADDQTVPLITTVQIGNTEIVKLLLDRGADANAKGEYGRTALFQAASQGRKEAAELLLARKADVNLQTQGGWTPLHAAVQEGHKEIVELLLANGADVNVRNKDGTTPLMLLKRSTQSGHPDVPAAQIGTPVLRLPPVPSPSVGTAQPANREEIVGLLRQRGAVEESPDFRNIRIARGSREPLFVFARDPNSLNRFTLLEALLNHYRQRPTGFGVDFVMPFPDLTRIRIQRWSGSKPNEKEEITVNLLAGTNGIDYAKDVPLEFGDVIEIPERDHSLAEKSVGLTDQQRKEMEKCTERKVKFVVRGESVETTFPGYTDSAYLFSALRHSQVQNILRSSSDLSRTTVQRIDPVTKKTTKLSVEPKAGPDDLWLRDGDVIEVPDKP